MGDWIDQSALFLAAAILVPAVVTDIRERRIPNTLCLGGFLAALTLHLTAGGITAFAMALGGASLIFGIVVPVYARGWLGAGDIKLIATMGAVAGTPPSALAMLAAITIAGGFLAVYVHLTQRRTAVPVIVAPEPGARPVADRPGLQASPPGHRGMPYAIAIAFGSLTVLLAQALAIT